MPSMTRLRYNQQARSLRLRIGQPVATMSTMPTTIWSRMCKSWQVLQCTKLYFRAVSLTSMSQSLKSSCGWRWRHTTSLTLPSMCRSGALITKMGSLCCASVDFKFLTVHRVSRLSTSRRAKIVCLFLSSALTIASRPKLNENASYCCFHSLNESFSVSMLKLKSVFKKVGELTTPSYK